MKMLPLLGRHSARRRRRGAEWRGVAHGPGQYSSFITERMRVSVRTRVLSARGEGVSETCWPRAGPVPVACCSVPVALHYSATRWRHKAVCATTGPHRDRNGRIIWNHTRTRVHCNASFGRKKGEGRMQGREQQRRANMTSK